MGIFREQVLPHRECVRVHAARNSARHGKLPFPSRSRQSVRTVPHRIVPYVCPRNYVIPRCAALRCDAPLPPRAVLRACILYSVHEGAGRLLRVRIYTSTVPSYVHMRSGECVGEDYRVKDSTGPCDCIKDSDGSRPVKKTRIVSMPTLTLLSLVNTSLSSKFWCVSTSLSSPSPPIPTQFHLTVTNITIFTCRSCIP